MSKIKVAAYCRVGTPEQMDLDWQIEYVKKHIENHPEWEFAGVYAEAARALPLNKRPAMQRLCKDALNGEFQKVISISASRYARDTIGLIRMIQYFKEHGVSLMTIKEGNIADYIKHDFGLLKVLEG